MIITETARATELATAGTTNNPFFLWDSLITAATSTHGVATGGDAENCLTGDTFDRAMPLESLNRAKLEFTTSGAITCVGIGAHNLGDVESEILLQYSDDGGSTWTSINSPAIEPTDNAAIVFRFSSQSETDWRLRISNSTGQVSIGVLMAGNELIPTQRIYQGYAPPIVPNVVRLVPRTSEGGEFLGATVTSRGSQATAEFQHLTPAELRGTDFKGFLTHYNEGNGFFWAWRPTKYDDAHFARSAGPMAQPVNSGPKDYMSLSLGMQFYDDP